MQILREIPDELTMVFFYNLCAAILAVTLGLLAETNRSLWKIRLDISLASIVCTVRYPLEISSSLSPEKLKEYTLKLMQFVDYDVLIVYA